MWRAPIINKMRLNKNFKLRSLHFKYMDRGVPSKNIFAQFQHRYNFSKPHGRNVRW